MSEPLARQLAYQTANYPASREKAPFLPSKEKGPLITDFYNVENDVSFLLKYTRNSPQEVKEHYLKENIYGLLAEFAGKVPYRKISYLLGDGGLTYGEIKMTEMLKHTTDIGGEREKQENIGQSWIYQEFEESHLRASVEGGQPLQHAALLSPPKKWQYGFLFYYATEFDQELGREVVRMHAIKYDEKQDEIYNSQKILNKLNPQLFYKNTQEFLETPVFDLVKTPNLNAVLMAAGVSSQDVAYSHWFEEAVKQDAVISYGVNNYLRLALELSENTDSLDAHLRQKVLQVMELTIVGIYNRAKEIRENYSANLNGTSPSIKNEQLSGPQLYENAYAAYGQILAGYSSQPAVVVGGGSCPVPTKSGGDGFPTSYSLSEGLNKGQTIESQLSGKNTSKRIDYKDDPNLCQCGQPNSAHFHCPGKTEKGAACKHPIIVGTRTSVCPGCGLAATCA